jgi:hypothetical protein
MNATTMCEYRSAGSVAVSESIFRFQKRLRASIVPHCSSVFCYICPFVIDPFAQRKMLREKETRRGNTQYNKNDSE